MAMRSSGALFPPIYRCTYFAAMILDLVIVLLRWPRIEDHVLEFWLAIFTMNLVSYSAYFSGLRAAAFSEAVLSLGRMLGIVMAASVIALALIGLFSPVRFVLWTPLAMALRKSD